MTELDKKKELILAHELEFANALGAAVFEKPKVSFWMILVPLLFLYFIHRMQTYKNGRIKFNEDFMDTRRRALECAVETLNASDLLEAKPTVRQAELSDSLEKPYAAWLEVLVDHYRDLLAADGHDFDTLTRKAYHTRTNYLLTLNRLNTVEKEYYAALKPQLDGTEGTADIIAIMEKESQRLRRDLAEQVFG